METQIDAHMLLHFPVHREMRRTLQVDIHWKASTEQMQGDSNLQFCTYTWTELPNVPLCYHFATIYSFTGKKSGPELNDQPTYIYNLSFFLVLNYTSATFNSYNAMSKHSQSHVQKNANHCHNFQQKLFIWQFKGNKCIIFQYLYSNVWKNMHETNLYTKQLIFINTTVQYQLSTHGTSGAFTLAYLLYNSWCGWTGLLPSLFLRLSSLERGQKQTLKALQKIRSNTCHLSTLRSVCTVMWDSLY